MSFAALILPVLLAAAPAADQGEAFSWCVAEAADTRGPVRYFTDTSHIGADESEEIAFREYVEQAYLKRKDAGVAVSCRTFGTSADADAALLRASSSPVDGTVVMTAWRTHFE